MLRRTDETRRALLASVSHDLRTPLASIKASAESLLQDEVAWTPGDRRGFTLAIREEADRLNRLVENLLDVSRIEAGALRPEREWYPWTPWWTTSSDGSRATARHRLVVDVPDDLPPVPLDYVLVGQALTNLIENAVKYTPPGAPSGHGRPEGDAVVLAVIDDGPGIPAPPRSASSTSSTASPAGTPRRTPGTGLGSPWSAGGRRPTAGRPA